MLGMSGRARAQLLEDRLVRLGARGCRIAARLPRSPLARPIGTQLVRACTSPAANYAEARESESRRDFAHKLKVCLKELRETRVWLELIDQLELLNGKEGHEALAEVDELISIFVASVSTSKRNQTKRS